MLKLLSRVGKMLRGRTVIDEDLLEELEEALIQADVTVSLAMELVETLREEAEQQRVTDTEGAGELLKTQIRAMFENYETPLNVAPTPPTTFLVLGVNGVGKTTSIAKIANMYQSQGRKVILAAGDTFRAAAIDQLEIWANRVGCEIVRQQPDSDPAAVVFDALEAARARGTDLVIIDTAGRLHTKHNLMEELRKINRVVERQLGRPADERLLVLDATTGQNALNQARQFNESIGLSGLVLTKLDGTSKGGIVLSIVRELKLPIKLIGVGEKMTDLRPFDSEEFVNSLF